MAIKLSKKKVAAYKKSQTTPKTPSKVIPFIDRMRVSINFEPGEMAEEVQSNIWAQVADKDAFTQVASKGRGVHRGAGMDGCPMVWIRF